MVKHEKDARTQKSILRMKQALLSFLEQEPLHEIKVSKLCKHCGINRTTFYAYYTDIYDLADAIGNDIITELTELMAVPNPPHLQAKEVANRFLAYLYANRTTLRLLLTRDYRMHFIRRLNDVLTEFLQQSVREQYVVPPEVSQEDLTNVVGFVVFGHYSYYKRFIFDETPLSEEDIARAAKIFADLSEGCLQHYLHLKEQK